MKLSGHIALLLLLLLAAAGCRLSTPISPGPLSAVHQDLEGTQNCTKCHTLRQKVTDAKCLDCHENIDMMINEERGYHASKEVSEKNCSECHNDHHGRDFEIIHFDTSAFDHDLSGYVLKGKHASVSCSSCHRQEHITARELQGKKSTYLGLDDRCLGCHEDQHRGMLSENCAACHNFNGFIPAGNFDHSRSDYKLTGQHEDVECAGCHPLTVADGKNIRKYAGLAYKQCTPCHTDIHESKFGAKCSDCHTTQSFLLARTMEGFDHTLTGYSLTGMHRLVDCEGCHGDRSVTSLEHDQCRDCHDDHHNGIFGSRNPGSDCGSCHTVGGFAPATYTVEDHQRSRFALTGAHESVTCTACHLKGSEWAFRQIGIGCIDCHEDIHSGSISGEYYSARDCKVCHMTDAWSSIEFNHEVTGFALEGGHAEANCRACHFSTEKGHSGQQFSELTDNCINCHTDIHVGQFGHTRADDCLRCHGFQDWRASKFDHDHTNFKLDGQHIDVACTGCHMEVSRDNRRYIQYKIESYRCEDCH